MSGNQQRKAGRQFPEHDEGQPDFIGELNRLYDRYNALAKVSVTVGVEGQLHGHISSSILS